MQVTSDNLADVRRGQKLNGANAARSGCPVSIWLERFGDRWSLLLIRDMMVRGHKTFKEFEHSGEGIATNILANRLARLHLAGIIETERDESDARRVIYRLTEKGIDLAPLMLELLVWAARWEETAAPCEVMEYMEGNRGMVVAEVRRRWRERDPEPFLPPFAGAAKRVHDAGISNKRIRKGVKR